MQYVVYGGWGEEILLEIQRNQVNGYSDPYSLTLTTTSAENHLKITLNQNDLFSKEVSNFYT